MNEMYYKDEVLNRNTTHCNIRPMCKYDALVYITHFFLLTQYEVTQNRDGILPVLQNFKVTVTWDLFQMRMCILSKIKGIYFHIEIFLDLLVLSVLILKAQEIRVSW